MRFILHPNVSLLISTGTTKDLIGLARLQNSTPVNTPVEVNVKYKHDEVDLLLDPTIYCHPVRSLVHLTITQPDIVHVVKLMSQFMTNP